MERLNVVSRRFSNIESTPELERMEIVERINHFISYFKTRISGKITIELHAADTPLYANLNGNLFEWVLENMGKNAVDAMEGEGFIRISCGKDKKNIWIDMQDNGKGMSRKNARRVFMPGFTTKTRGWGVGMTLCLPARKKERDLSHSFHTHFLPHRKNSILHFISDFLIAPKYLLSEECIRLSPMTKYSPSRSSTCCVMPFVMLFGS